MVGFFEETLNLCVVIGTLCARFLMVCALVMPFAASAQTAPGRCVILGKVVDATTNAPLPFASVVLQGQSSGTATDFEGAYRLEGVPAGVHNVVVSFLGYTPETVFEIETTPARPAVVNVALTEAAIAVDAAEVVAESRATVEEAPLRAALEPMKSSATLEEDGTSAGHCVRCRVAAIPSFGTTSSFAVGHPMRIGFTSTASKFPTSTTSPPKAPVGDLWG